MSIERNDMELYRSAWRQWRAQIKLTDPEANDFGRGGLAARVEAPSIRLLVLPQDPDRDVVEFDADFWQWWETLPPDPVTGRRQGWLHNHCPTAYAAAHYGYNRSVNAWERYLALYRNGSLEMELGDYGARTLDNEKRCFLLVQSVGRIWHALQIYSQIVERFSLSAPFEVTLALQGSKGALLGSFGKGWADLFSGLVNPLPCSDSHLLFRVEMTSWLQSEEIQALAFRLGGRIEDAWGISDRRFLDRSGPRNGQFANENYG